MEKRILGRTGKAISVVGLGCWQLGADWGVVSESDALAVLSAAADNGVTFFDTADVYGDGRSETLIGTFLKERANDLPEPITVATKMGRRADPLVPEAFHLKAFQEWVDRSRRNLGTDTLDLVQLHCPPTAVYSNDAVYDALDQLVEQGSIAAYGVSVETCDEALTALARPNVATIQIILNALRHKPLEQVLPKAVEAGVAIIARVPLASGLLTGKYTATTQFDPSDHRNYNRDGSAFDVGETFSGVPYEVGIQAAQRFAAISESSDANAVAALALRWILDQRGVTTVIPGARNAQQAGGNASAASLPSFTPEQLAAVDEIYNELIREHVHPRW